MTDGDGSYSIRVAGQGCRQLLRHPHRSLSARFHLGRTFLRRLVETLGPGRSEGQGVLVVLVLGDALLGMLNSFAPLNRSNMLVRPADAKALDWIAANIPTSAKSLVNLFSPSGEGGVMAGSEAGWWIPLWPRGGNSVPPMNYMWERLGQADFEEIYTLAEIDLEQIGSRNALSVLERHGITHVSVGRQGGGLKAEVFARSPIYREIHSQGAVAIFEIE